MNTKLNHDPNWLEMARLANWSVEKLAIQCGVSVRTLERFFLRSTGKAPKAWLVEQRQREAAELLRRGRSIKEIARLLGYRHANQLSREFKHFWGAPPTSISAPHQNFTL